MAALSAGAFADPPESATFVLAEGKLHHPLNLIAYGDMRFTDPANVTATNPQARQALVNRIAAERPDALFLNGDIPYIGGDPKDYAEFHRETTAWRKVGLRVFPALGNHEFKGCEPAACLENWWSEFPALKGRRWYSVQLGGSFYGIGLDSDTSLMPGSEQMQWLSAQLEALPRTVRFLMIWMHHPPVADLQPEGKDNPRDNELALKDFLKDYVKNGTGRPRLLVVAAHVHNYERFERDGITYLVSGGGGAKPSPVERESDDLFQSKDFPNYHYLKLILAGNTLRVTMYRLDPQATQPTWNAADHFELSAAAGP
jgi:calcineurin-like phosphoesterase family protein